MISQYKNYFIIFLYSFTLQSKNTTSNMPMGQKSMVTMESSIRRELESSMNKDNIYANHSVINDKENSTSLDFNKDTVIYDEVPEFHEQNVLYNTDSDHTQQSSPNDNDHTQQSSPSDSDQVSSLTD